MRHAGDGDVASLPLVLRVSRTVRFHASSGSWENEFDRRQKKEGWEGEEWDSAQIPTESTAASQVNVHCAPYRWFVFVLLCSPISTPKGPPLFQRDSPSETA